MNRYNISAALAPLERETDGAPIAFGYLLTPGRVVLCDDTGTARSAVQHLRRENARLENGIGNMDIRRSSLAAC